MIQQIDRKDLINGCVLGLAVGSALGVGAQSSKAGESVEPVSDVRGGGLYELKRGEWTSEVSMAMCLAESYLECGEFDRESQWQSYLKWFEHGHWSCRDFSFAVEPPMRGALQAYKQGRAAEVSAEMHQYAGVLVRVAPVVLCYLGDAQGALFNAAASTELTHPSRLCVDAVRYFSAILYGALMGEDKERLLSPDYAPPGIDWAAAPLTPEIEQVRAGAYLSKPDFALGKPDDLVSILKSALWSFAHSNHFKEGALKAVNMRGKPTAAGALYGQLAGAYYGAEHMPDNWLRVLAYREALEAMAHKLWLASLS